MARRKPPTPDAPLVVDHVLFVLGRAYFAYVGVLERVLDTLDLDQYVQPGTGHVLFALFEEDDRSISEIAARAQLSPSTLTGLLGRMAKAGLIERHRDPADGRVIRIRLTRLARSIELRCHAAMASFTELLAGEFLPAELHVVESSLRRLLTVLRQAEGR